MIDTSQFKTGVALVLDGELFSIVEYQHVKPGKGGAFVRTKLRHMTRGTIIDRTFRAGEKFENAFLEERSLEYLYRTGNELHFMDHTTYEQATLDHTVLGNQIGFLKENMEVAAMYHDGKLLTVALPNFVQLKIEQAEPGVKGDTAKGGSKSARLETGATIQVPLFIDVGEVVKVDTRTGEYVGRA